MSDRTRIEKEELAGKESLEEIVYPISSGKKCAHNHGRWMVSIGGRIYGFRPATQLQKDIWLGEQEDEKAAERLLRWYCFECGTLQQP